METDTMLSQRLNCPIFSMPKLNVDPKEENGSEIPFVDFYLKHHKEDSNRDDQFINSAPIQRMENVKEELDQTESDLCLGESSHVKWETTTLKNMQVESTDRSVVIAGMEPCTIKNETNDVNEIAAEKLLNYGYEVPFKSESIEWEEVYIKQEENNQDSLKRPCKEEDSRDDEFQEAASVEISEDEKKTWDKWNIDKDLDNDITIVMESSDVKKETNTENATTEELLNYDSGTPFQPKIQQTEVHIRSTEEKKEKLNKKTRKPRNQHQCPECSYSTAYITNLKSHSVKHKNLDEVDWYNCQECPYKTIHKYKLKYHIEIHKNLTLKCSKCSYETSRSATLRNHQVKHKTNIEWLHCPECSFKTHRQSLIRNHILAHKSDAFKCPTCSYHSRTKYQLIVHQVKHESKDKWHSCSLCPFKTHNKVILKQHSRRHRSTTDTNPKKIKNTDSSYKNGTKEKVQTYQLIHDQSSWLQCPDCAYKTAYKGNLKKHQVLHQGANGEGWHRCPECSYKSPSKHTLQLHAMSHKSPDEIQWYKCSQCSFKTAYKDYIKRHQLKHKAAHELEWLFCYECSFKTARKTSLVRHITKHKTETDNSYLENSGK